MGYKIKFADLRNTSLYKDFIGLSDYEVGDIVPIHHQRLNIDTQSKIVKTVYDVLRQKKISMDLGQQPGDITKRQYFSDTIFTSSPDVQAIQTQLGGLTNANTL